MEKDKTIIELINKIRRHAELENLEVVDCWDADLCAIGFKKEGRLAYVSTYSYFGAAEMKYDLDLELLKDSEEQHVVRVMRGIAEVQLLTEIKEFLLQVDE